MAHQTVEYYLVAGDSYFRVEWAGADPAFVVVAPLQEVLAGVGAFDNNAVAVWPGETGTPYFYLPAAEAPGVAAILADFDWDSFVTAGRIRDTLGVSDESGAELVDRVMREAHRLCELTRLAAEESTGLLCVVY
jgi:hypothetical protein